MPHAFDDADFTVRSAVDGATFAVNRAKLNGSHVFRDMFSLCDTEEVLDLHEPESSLSALLRLLHTPPEPPKIMPSRGESEKVITTLPVRYDAHTAIPLPILRLLFYLTDKYALCNARVLDSLKAHLLAHAPADPLTVYGLALTLGDMADVVSESSQYILPLACYTLEEIQAGIPTVRDYHQIHELQAFRVKALQEILVHKHSDLFPHDFGTCPTHSTGAAAAWDRARNVLARKIESNTDVAGEMQTMAYIFQSCGVCSKAFTAAVEMLAYKCRRVRRTIVTERTEDEDDEF